MGRLDAGGDGSNGNVDQRLTDESICENGAGNHEIAPSYAYQECRAAAYFPQWRILYNDAS